MRGIEEGIGLARVPLAVHDSVNESEQSSSKSSQIPNFSLWDLGGTEGNLFAKRSLFMWKAKAMRSKLRIVRVVAGTGLPYGLDH